MKGRKPLPTNVHLLRGNPSKLPADRLRIGADPEAVIPECPEHLSPIARVEWARLAPELLKLGLISQLDRAGFAVYCQAYGRWVHAEQMIAALGEDGLVATTPTGFSRPSIWLRISEQAAAQCHRFMAEFGLTPSARSRVKASPQLGLFGDDDPYFT